MYSTETGDLFSADVDVIAHGCNCDGLMGAGIAVTVRDIYGEGMYQEYRQQCLEGKFKPGSAMLWHSSVIPTLFNLGTQLHGGACARYDYIGTAVRNMCNTIEKTYAYYSKIGIPAIGCGIGGLNLTVVNAVLDDLMKDFPSLELVMYLQAT